MRVSGGEGGEGGRRRGLDYRRSKEGRGAYLNQRDTIVSLVRIICSFPTQKMGDYYYLFRSALKHLRECVKLFRFFATNRGLGT